MKCKKCNHELPETAQFCSMCGTKVEKEKVCLSCGCKLEEDAKFCMLCGAKVEADKNIEDTVENLFINFFDDAVNAKNTQLAPSFNGEYYYSDHHRCVSVYNDVLYYIDDYGYVYACKKDNSCEKLVDTAWKAGSEYDSYRYIFVNEFGIFAYKTHTDRGKLVTLYDFDGKEISTFKVDARGPVSDKNMYCNIYIVGSKVYFANDKQIIAYDMMKECATSPIEPQIMLDNRHATIWDLIATEDALYVKCVFDSLQGHDNRAWAKLIMDDSMTWCKEIKFIFLWNSSDYDDENIWFFPKHESLWIGEKRVATAFDTSSVSGINTSKKLSKLVEMKLGTKEVIGKVLFEQGIKIQYFDGKNMLYSKYNDKEGLCKVDMSTGEGEELGAGLGYKNAFYTNEMYVMQDNVYCKFDFGDMEHYYVKLGIEDNTCTKICQV